MSALAIPAIPFVIQLTTLRSALICISCIGGSMHAHLAAQQFAALPGSALPASNAQTSAIVMEDFDGDGTVDMFCGNVSATGAQNHLYLGDGRGKFTDVTATHLPVDGDNENMCVAVDVDGDGDLDIVCGNGGGQDRLYLNDGSAAFSDAPGNLPAHPSMTLSLAFGDFDNDGDIDLVCGNDSSARLLMNDGSGIFSDESATRLPAIIGSMHTISIAVADVDGDGDLDIAFGNVGPQFSSANPTNRLYLNDGSGMFTWSGQLPLDSDDTLVAVFADVDNDGDPDLICGNWGPSRLYENDGQGAFHEVTATQMATLGAVRAMAVGDIDHDGDVDIVTGNRVLTNDGLGTFSDVTATRWGVTTMVPESVVLTDVDRDSDLDVIVLAFNAPDQLFTNLARQPQGASPAQIGGTFVLEAYARFGPPSLVNVAVPYLSTAEAAIPVTGLGLLGIDPNQMVPLPPFLVPQPAGVGQLAVGIPNAPALVGLAFYCQSLLLQWPHVVSLSNVTARVIVP